MSKKYELVWQPDDSGEGKHVDWKNGNKDKREPANNADGEEIAVLMDMDCESANLDGLCGVHRQFWMMWKKEFGYDMGMKLIRQFAEETGGLTQLYFRE
ncbi:hypothetical protein C4577_06515 [Candidatus Parcubacteria bacterium]|nr:MAG: hypothetical protein C4577_06515 [Candidatus Parcubacteria bacterium]